MSEKKETIKKQMKGTVVSDAMEKSIVVAVKKYIQHPKYKKYYTRTKRYKVHDPENAYQVGDVVYITPAPPQSKGKRFNIVGNA